MLICVSILHVYVLILHIHCWLQIFNSYTHTIFNNWTPSWANKISMCESKLSYQVSEDKLFVPVLESTGEL